MNLKDRLDAELQNEPLIFSFHLWMQSEREGRNPKTGEKCMIRSRSSVKFKPGKKMLENLNGQVISN